VVPERPAVGREHVNFAAARRQHAANLRVQARKMGDVLRHVRRERDVDAGARQRDRPAVVVPDGKNALRGIGRIRDLDRGDVEAAPLQFQRLLAGASPMSRMRAPAGKNEATRRL